MAIWDSIKDKTTVEAKAFKRSLNRKALDVLRRKNATLFRVLGKMDRLGSSDPKSTNISFERSVKCNGLKHSVLMMAAQPTFTYPTDGAQEYAAATMSYDADIAGSADFDICHGTLHVAIVNSEAKIVSGDSVRGESLMDMYQDYAIGGLDKAWSDGMLSTNAPARATIGGAVYAIDDGANASAPAGAATGGNASYSDYGGLLRATAANSVFGPYVKGGGGEMTIPLIQEGINYATIAGGNPTLCPVGVALFSKAQQLAQGYVQTAYDKEWDKFGGKYVNIGGVDFALEGGANAPTNMLMFIDPTTWIWVQNSDGVKTDFHDAPWLEASGELTMEWWAQFICKAPWRNSKITGVTV
jgi:hypothetical protein